jgi:hypothetical protein
VTVNLDDEDSRASLSAEEFDRTWIEAHVARLGPEAVAQNLEPGDRIQVEYLVGVAVKITRVVPTA